MQPEQVRLAVYAAAFVADANRQYDAGEPVTDAGFERVHAAAEMLADKAVETLARVSAERGTTP